MVYGIFSIQNRGDNVLLCQLMDYDCNYNTNSRRLEEAVGHLIDAHNCLYTCDENNQVVLNGISKLMNGQETSWEPLVFNFGGTKIILLTKSELNTIAFNCISLGDQKNKWKMQFEIAGKSTEVIFNGSFFCVFLTKLLKSK